MILISNSQRDDAVRYLEAFAVSLTGGSTKEYNSRRLARKLARILAQKQPLAQLPGLADKGPQIKDK